MTEGVKLTKDQFWALERWIIAHAWAAAIPPGSHRSEQLQSIRDTAYVALTGNEPPTDRSALNQGTGSDE